MLVRMVMRISGLRRFGDGEVQGCLRHHWHRLRARAVSLQQGEKGTTLVLVRRLGRLKSLSRWLHLEQTLELLCGTIKSLNGRDMAWDESLGRRPGIIFGCCGFLGSKMVMRIARDATPYSSLIDLLLRSNPLLQGHEERSDHVELVCCGAGSVFLVLGTLLAKCRELRKLVPLDFADFFPGSRLKVCIHRDVAEDIETKLLLAHGYLNVLWLLLGRNQTCFAKIKTGFLVDFSDRTVQVVLILVDLTPREAPVGALLPTLDKDDRVHGMVEHDGAANGHARLVLQEFFKSLGVVLDREGCQQRAMLEDAEAKGSQGHGRQGRV